MPKKISVDTLRALNKINKEKIVTIELGEIDGTKITADIHKYLDLPSFCKLIAGVMNADFDGDEHAPWNGKILFSVRLVEAYMPDLNLPDDIGEAYLLINELGIYDKVIDVAGDTEQFNDLVEAIYSSRELTKVKNTGINGLWEVIKNILKNFDVGSILEILQGFDLEQLENLNEIRQMANLFTQRVSPDNNGGDSSDKIIPLPKNSEVTE